VELIPARADLPADIGAKLAARLERARTRTAAATLERRPAGAPAVLSPAQRRLWFLDQWRPGASYNVPVAWRLTGPVDAGALGKALCELVRRHQVLRTCYRAVEGEPRPLVLPQTAFALRELGPVDERELVASESRRPFDLATELPVRATLGRVPGGAVLTLVVHHIAADGWSIGLLARELSALYTGEALAEPPAQYADVAGHPSDDGRLGYWRERLAGAPAVLDLPSDRPRPPRPSGRGAIHRFALGEALGHGVHELARAERATPFAVLLAAFSAACARWSGEEDVIVGTPVAGRGDAGLESLVGCFVNTLPVRTRVDGRVTGRELVARVRGALLADLEHELPFERLVEGLGAERDQSTTPLVQVLFVAADFPRSPLELEGVLVEELPVDPGAAKLDLSLTVDTSGGLDAMLTYSADRFDATAAARLAEQFRTLLAALLADPDAPVAALPLAAAPAAAEPLTGPAGSVLEHYAAAVARAPDAPAVAGAGTTLTYAELHERATALAGRLRALGAGPEERVALLVERSPDAIVGLLGILLSGAAYVPIEPGQPQARVDMLLREAGARLIVTRRPHRPRGDGAVCVDEPHAPLAAPLPPVDPASLAYVIFTSGTTGVPKGVAVEHRQLRAYVDAIVSRLGVPKGSSFAVASTLAADLGHTSVFPALCSGGLLHVLGAEQGTDPAAFGAYLARHPVDVLKIVPSHLAALLTGPDPATALPRRQLVLGGEACPRALVERVRELAPGLAVTNHYGPTETTVGALTHDVPAALDSTEIPIGRPLPHAVARVLDTRRQPLPPGIAGELYLGGAGVARGYLGDPALTAQRFVPDSSGARLYRTGDIVRLRDDGAIEFLGRADDQVKLRGHRVELGEVAAALREQPGVRDAVAIVREQRLVGYVAAPREVAVALRAALTERLPAHLVPSAIVRLDALPLNANGKLDRRALPDPEPVERTAASAPTTPTEARIAALWAELLGACAVGRDDDFFALGGHSLVATRVVAHLRRDLGLEVPLQALFEHPTLVALAAYVDALAWAARPAAPADGVYEEGAL
jgi:amino acid adenylation domain-containing protein